QLVFVVSASPARGIGGPRPNNAQHWEDLLHPIADEHGGYGGLAQLGGFEGGKGFPRGSFVVRPRGDIHGVGPLWGEARVQATMGRAEFPLAGADLPLLADLETMLPHMQHEIERARRGEQAIVRWDARETRDWRLGASKITPSLQSPASSLKVVTQPPFDPDADILRIDAEATRRWLIEFL